ncbi:MAG: KpsF/GutQ family sugar-phosphate isomerase [Vampirovibrionales bacterium]|nr:KpsF/GutQ family sugar-phosphate isomerase [Vampirovibrionales bacterium]
MRATPLHQTNASSQALASQTPDAQVPEAQTAEELTLAQARAVIRIEQQGLQALADNLDAQFAQAATLILNCKGRVVVTGMGKSGLVGKKIAATLASTGTPAYFLHPAEGSHGDLGLLGKDDVILGISYSGETAELLAIIPAIKRLNLPMIALTSNLNSTLAKHAQVKLNIAVPEEACPMGLAPTASTTATLALGDALAVVLLKARGFTPDDFAMVHPAGSLGKRLLLTVGDLMHSDAQLPLVYEDTPFLEALLEMNAKKLGLTLVIKADQQLSGILTDGDVRRAITRYSDVRDVCVAEVMSPSPKTVTPDELAASALRRMEAHQITALVVARKDAPQRPIGIVHLHDLIRQGL